MSAHVSALCRSCYFQLRQLRLIARSLTTDTTRTLVQAFIACRLDYCNSLFHGTTDTLFQRLQSIQSAAARLATGTRCSEHIQPVLRRHHWLPVRKRVDFKLATLVYQALHGLFVNLLLTPVAASYVHLPTIHTLFLAHTTVSAIEVLVSPALHYGTVYQHHFGHPNTVFPHSSDCLSPVDSNTATHCFMV